MKTCELKKLVKLILKEVYSLKEGYGERFGTSGEWLEPNGKAHDVGRKIHYVWADDYLRSQFVPNFGDPYEYLINRGWVRVIYVANDALIMISHKLKLTPKQLSHLEDQSEETEWAVVDDDGRMVYQPIYCKTSEDILTQYGGEVVGENIDALYHNQSAPMSQCSGYSHDVTIPDITQMVRDPLNDPRLNNKLDEENKNYSTKHFTVKFGIVKGIPDYGPDIGKVFLNGETYFCNAVYYKEGLGYGKSIDGKWVVNKAPGAWKLNVPEELVTGYDTVEDMLNTLEKWYSSRTMNEQYKFDDFKWLARRDGFGMPTDVYYGSILLGVIVSQPNGYLVAIVKGPTSDVSYKQSPQKPFKTKSDAAEALHRAWKSLRHREETEIS